jgi:hypothetical protein
MFLLETVTGYSPMLRTHRFGFRTVYEIASRLLRALKRRLARFIETRTAMLQGGCHYTFGTKTHPALVAVCTSAIVRILAISQTQTA